jgi:hypothetical protein
VKSCSLRLLDDHRDELIIKSVYGLSEAYLNKGPVTVAASTIDRAVASTGMTESGAMAEAG